VSTRTPSPKSERIKLNANENANAAPTSVSAPETVPLENVSNQEMSSTEDPIPTHAPLANVGTISTIPGIEDTAPTAAVSAEAIKSPLFFATP